MADGQSMTVADVVAKTMDGRLEDFVREAVALVARELMEGEISVEIGAALGEVAPESRLTHRIVLEAYVNGVSTRKVDRLVEQLGIDGMTKDRVSAMCRALDERVEAFCQRPLEGAYPYLWLDAKQVKVRD